MYPRSQSLEFYPNRVGAASSFGPGLSNPRYLRRRSGLCGELHMPACVQGCTGGASWNFEYRRVDKEATMNNLLYIKASPRGDRSYSATVADVFVDAYGRAHPDDRVTTMDVFYDDLPDFDFEAASAKYKIMHGKEHSEQDKQVWNRIVSVINDFTSADKYVFAVPMWNFSIPYRLKQYIDVIVQPGYTFTVTEEGNYQGLVTDKPVLVFYARGGAYAPGSQTEPFDLQTKYLELILRFIGLTDIRSIVIEPTLMNGPEAAAESKANAIKQAREIALDF